MPFNLTYRAFATFTVSCSAGEGVAVTESASASSIISQRDADLKALEYARGKAQAKLECSFPPAPGETRYYNDEVSASAVCPSGSADPSGAFDPSKQFAAIIAAGSVYSTVSASEATSAAQARANAELAVLLSRTCLPYYENTEQSYTAQCFPPYTGASVTETVPAGTYRSFVHPEAADGLAREAAQIAAEAALSCSLLFWNTPQTATVSCTPPEVGADSIATVPAGTYSSSISQAAADTAALNAATALATSLLSCITGYANTEQTAIVNCEDAYTICHFGNSGVATVPANTYFSPVSQEAADALALDAATAEATAQLDCYINPNCVPPAP